jgi:hypothetical protein
MDRQIDLRGQKYCGRGGHEQTNKTIRPGPGKKQGKRRRHDRVSPARARRSGSSCGTQHPRHGTGPGGLTRHCHPRLRIRAARRASGKPPALRRARNPPDDQYLHTRLRSLYRPDGWPRGQYLRLPRLNVRRPAPYAISADVANGRCSIAPSRRTSKPGWHSLPGNSTSHRPPISSAHFAAISNAAASWMALPVSTVMGAGTIP